MKKSKASNLKFVSLTPSIALFLWPNHDIKICTSAHNHIQLVLTNYIFQEITNQNTQVITVILMNKLTPLWA